LLLCEARNALGTPYDRQAQPRYLLTLPSEPFSGDPKEWSARDILYQYVRVPAVWRVLIWLESSISLDEVASLVLAAVVAAGSEQTNFATLVIAAHPDWVEGLRVLLGAGLAIWFAWKLGLGRSRRAVLASIISLALGIVIVAATTSQFGPDQLLSALAVALYIDLLSSFIDLVGLFKKGAA
jgi:hypothetical protein